MTGTLELLCGPSGVGKTSYIPERTKQYRWTTRPKRPDEIDSREWDGTKTTHGFFVKEDEFLANDDLIGVHRYPDKSYGSLYGLPRTDIKSATSRGEDLYEQIIPLETIGNVTSQIECKVTAIRSLLYDIKANIVFREPDFLDERINLAREELGRYCDELENFDEVFFNVHAGISLDEVMKNFNFCDEQPTHQPPPLDSDGALSGAPLNPSQRNLLYLAILLCKHEEGSTRTYGPSYPLHTFYCNLQYLPRLSITTKDDTLRKFQQLRDIASHNSQYLPYETPFLIKTYHNICTYHSALSTTGREIRVINVDGIRFSQEAVYPFIPILVGTIYRELGDWERANKHVRTYLKSFRNTWITQRPGHFLKTKARIFTEWLNPYRPIVWNMEAAVCDSASTFLSEKKPEKNLLP